MFTTQQRSRFIQECLERTNEHRCKHGVPALRLNQKLSSISQDWAEHLLRSNCLSHNPRARYLDTDLGENVAYNFKSSGEVRGSEMIDQWYNEISDYNFNTHSSHKTTGHFTQLVWKNSKEVGFGLAASNGRHYLVSNYFPPGNYVGQYKDNVFPAQNGGSRKIFGGTTSNKTSSQPNPATQTSTPQKTHQKQQNFEAINWTFRIGDDSIRPETRDPTKVETWKFQDRPKDGARKCQLQEPSVGGNLSRKHDEEKSIFGNLSSRLSSKLGLQNNDTKQETRHVTTAGKWKPSSTIVVTETFHDEPGSYTSTRSYVSNITDRGGVDFGKRIVRTTVRENPDPVQTTVRSSPFSLEASKSQQSQQQFEDEVLSGHNKYRRRHQAVSLTLNPQISRLAQNWADHMARNDELKFSGNKYLGQLLGESVALKYSSVPVDYLGSELVENWYKEKDDYNFNFPNERTNLDKIGHFTQMVWKGSREIGIGKAWSQDRKRVFVVCNYLPAGNVLGSFKENVVA